MSCPPTFKFRASQKVGGYLKVIFLPHMVKFGCFWSFFAQSQQKKRCPCTIPSSCAPPRAHTSVLANINWLGAT